MNKKLIISKTSLFIFVILFIMGFEKVFGSSNTLIGVTIITAALMLLERDFTLSPLAYLSKITLLNLFLGVSAFLTNQNIWLGILINFIVIFIIGFFLSFNFKSNIYIPFGLQYLFMVSTPVAYEQLKLRLFSLFVGSIFIIAINILLNKNRLAKSSNKIIGDISFLLLKKIEIINQKNDFQNINNEIKEYVIKLKKLIYYKRKRNFYITAGGILSLNILSLLEYLNEYLDNNLNEDTKKIYILLENRRDIDKLKKIKKQSINFKDNEFKDKIMLLCNYFIEFEQLKNHDYIHQSHEIPKSFNKIEIFKRDFNYNTMKFSYAFKLSICITISIFIMDYFKIYEARWMTYTVFSLIQPYREHSITKSKQRLKGSIIGGVIAFVMFSLINNKTIKSIIIAGAGYIDGYNTRYDRKMICVTISAVGVASMTSSIEVQLFYRILFVVAGIVLSLIANKVLLPYDLKDSTKDLINMSDSLIDSLKKEFKIHNVVRDNHTIENLFIIFTFIEEQVFKNDQEKYNEFIDRKRKIINRIYNNYICMKQNMVM